MTTAYTFATDCRWVHQFIEYIKEIRINLSGLAYIHNKQLNKCKESDDNRNE
jgi:hypothetical protein